ncbi:hypothetical protein LCGC14_1322870 [marine sediment metagenome]|uniref:Uncharacterized protein n=1 Tax=marine sediment metagenome TaxID=412755 RepID=A0A0F9KJF8_9ZZZZ
MRILLLIVSGFLVWLALAWLHVFTRVYLDGSFTAIEPNAGVLIVEIIFALVLALLGLVAFIFALRR